MGNGEKAREVGKKDNAALENANENQIAALVVAGDLIREFLCAYSDLFFREKNGFEVGFHEVWGHDGDLSH